MANWESVSILSRKREDAILVVVEAVEKWARAKRCPLFHSLLSTGSEGCQTTFTEKKLHNPICHFHQETMAAVDEFLEWPSRVRDWHTFVT